MSSFDADCCGDGGAAIGVRTDSRLRSERQYAANY